MEHTKAHQSTDQDEDRTGPHMLSPEELAVHCRLSYSKVRRLTAQGRIPAIFVAGQPRYVLADVLEAFAQAAAVTG